MTATETFEVGAAFAKRAIECDRKARETENNNLYQMALLDYTRAIEMFSLASAYQQSPATKQLLQERMNIYLNRTAILQDYLTACPRKQCMPRQRLEQVQNFSVDGKPRIGHEDLQSLSIRLNLSTPTKDFLPSLNDVVGLESAKQVLHEATILPKQFPDLFKERQQVWRNILLYGPPGVGKTYISKAIARESTSIFFNLTAGDLMAIFCNNYERGIEELFAAARKSGKVVFCFDDVDILFSIEGSQETEHLRRLKVQLLKELRNLQDSAHDVVFIATSRVPWLLEEAFLSRMDRRIYVGLPDARSRTKMLNEMLRDVTHTLRAEDIRNIATECEKYSCSDMKALAMDAKMEPLRVIQQSTHFREIWVDRHGKRVRKISPCSKDDDGAVEMNITDIQRSMLHIPSVTCLDFEVALDKTKPTVGFETVEKHLDFTSRTGQAG